MSKRNQELRTDRNISSVYAESYKKYLYTKYQPTLFTRILHKFFPKLKTQWEVRKARAIREGSEIMKRKIYKSMK